MRTIESSPQSWANDDTLALEQAFDAVHTGLTVEMIATPRERFVTCRIDERVQAVLSANVENFDFIPVVDDREDGLQIVGLLPAATLAKRGQADGSVHNHVLPLSEDRLIGADASILEFLLDADQKPCRLILSGSRISGLVSISDMQRLPVRAALFAVITGFEMAMTEVIRKVHPTDDRWMAFLNRQRQEKLLSEINESRTTDGFVDSLLFTQFCDKIRILAKSVDLGPSKKKAREQLKEIQNLRDALAHANIYAASPDAAAQACATIRNAVALRKVLGRLVREH